MECTDYIYCEDCKQYVDFYKYENMTDTGHRDCNWRFITDSELEERVSECEENGCFDTPY